MPAPDDRPTDLVGHPSDDWCADTPLSRRFPIYTRFNANDVLPDPITPLGADLVWKPHVLPGFTYGYVEMGALSTAEAIADPSAWPAAAFRYGHMYVNVTTARLNGIRSGLGWEVIDAGYFGNHPDAPPHDPHPDDLDPVISERIARRAQWTLTTTTYPDLEEDTRIADRLREQRPDLGQLSARALVAYARSVLPFERMMWRGEVVAGAQAAVGPATVDSVIPSDVAVSAIDLIGPPGDVVSAEPSAVLWRLSRVVRSSPALTDLFDDGVDGLLDRLGTDQRDFRDAFAAFIRTYGYRGPSEWDVGADSWETRPELAMALVDRLRLLDDSDAPEVRRAAAAADSAAAVAVVRERLAGDPDALATFELGLSSGRRFAAWRELGKSNCIKVINEARVALSTLGARLTGEGFLDSPREVFMALDDELDALCLEPEVVVPQIRQRAADWATYADLEVPLFLDARKPRVPVADVPRRVASDDGRCGPGDVLTGIAASAGTATGRVRVVTDIGAVDAFEPGEVLVAPQTDPSWTPLFLAAAAVVVAVGAPNSHAMIVSRELGIPCVASVDRATARLRDGQVVTVDGSAGTVTVH